MGEETPAPPAPTAGWYPGPDGQQRYFDGAVWTDRRPPRISGRTLAWLITAYTIALLCLIYALWPYGWWPL